jgi:predicted nucleic acid-binding protein
MTFDDLVSPADVFVDANTFIYHFTALTVYLQALVQIAQIGIQVFPVLEQHLIQASQQSRTHELLTGDALVVAVMQANGLTNLASLDTDFDRVPGITRYAPG